MMNVSNEQLRNKAELERRRIALVEDKVILLIKNVSVCNEVSNGIRNIHNRLLTAELAFIEILAHLLANICTNCSVRLLEDLREDTSMLQDHLQEIRDLVSLRGKVTRLLVQGPTSSELLLLPALEEPSRFLDAVQENDTNEEVRK